jgi:cytoskeletal protein RodZ
MQLNDILEENSLKLISQRTNISESNLEALIESDFAKLKRVKTLGFISILEREYKVDLSALKEQAIEYYDNNIDDESSVTVGLPLPEDKKGISIWFRLLIIGLILFTIWFFFTQFDKTQLSKYMPFSEDEISKIVSENIKKELGIKIDKEPTQTDVTDAKSENLILLDSEANLSQN